MNTHEEFITLDTARLAKQAGFDWEIPHLYRADILMPYISFDNHNKGAGNEISAPTQADLQRWLREVKKVQVYVTYSAQYKQYYYWVTFDCFNGAKGSANDYEAALEAGLQECLTKILEEEQ